MALKRNECCLWDLFKSRSVVGPTVHFLLALFMLLSCALFATHIALSMGQQQQQQQEEGISAPSNMRATISHALQSLIDRQKGLANGLSGWRGHTQPEKQTGKESRFLIQPYIPADTVSGPIRWSQLGERIRSDFTLRGRVQLVHSFFDKPAETNPPVWPSALITSMVNLARAKNPHVGRNLSHYGPPANAMFFQALEAYPVEGRSVLVVGSQHPWVEAICLGFQAAQVTTVDFNVPVVDYPRLRVLSLAQLDETDERFDAVFTYSSLEHDGLGRYGDPLHPWGDVERVRKLKGLLRPAGLLYLSVPNGNDTVVFNAHRVYGPIRFPMLIQGWKLLSTFGTGLEETFRFRNGYFHQPLHVLRPEG